MDILISADVSISKNNDELTGPQQAENLLSDRERREQPIRPCRATRLPDSCRVQWGTVLQWGLVLAKSRSKNLQSVRLN